MPAAANALDAIAGILTGLNQQADLNQQRQLQGLQLLAQQPGMQLTPAANVAPADFLSQLVGKPYAPTNTGAPVVQIAGQPVTVAPTPTFAEALPQIFGQAPPKGLETVWPILSQVKATPNALAGLPQVLLQAQGGEEARQLRRDALAAQQARQETLDKERERLQFERIRQRSAQDENRAGAQSLREQAERRRLVAELHDRYGAAGQSVPTELQGADTTLEDLRRGIVAAPPPTATPSRAGQLTDNAIVQSRQRILQMAKQNGVALNPAEVTNARTPDALAELTMKAGGGVERGRNVGAESKRAIDQAAKRMNDAIAGRKGLFDQLPGLAELTSPEQKQARQTYIDNLKGTIRVHAAILLRTPGFEVEGRRALESIGDAVPETPSVLPQSGAPSGTTTPTAAPLASGVPTEGFVGQVPLSNGQGVATARMIGVSDMAVNNGRETNIPLLVPGQEDIQGLADGKPPTKRQISIAINHASARIRRGEKIPSYNTREEAEAAARQESQQRGQQLAPPPTPAAPQGVAPSSTPGSTLYVPQQTAPATGPYAPSAQEPLRIISIRPR